MWGHVQCHGLISAHELYSYDGENGVSCHIYFATITNFSKEKFKSCLPSNRMAIINKQSKPSKHWEEEEKLELLVGRYKVAVLGKGAAIPQNNCNGVAIRSSLPSSGYLPTRRQSKPSWALRAPLFTVATCRSNSSAHGKMNRSTKYHPEYSGL